MDYTIENVLKYNGYKVNDHNIKLLQEGLQTGKYSLEFTDEVWYNLCKDALKESYEIYNCLLEIPNGDLNVLLKEATDTELHLLSTCIREFSTFFFYCDEKAQLLNESEKINLIEGEWNNIYNEIINEEEANKFKKYVLPGAIAGGLAYPLIKTGVAGGSAPTFLGAVGSGLRTMVKGAGTFLGTPVGASLGIGAGVAGATYALRKSSQLANARANYTKQFMNSVDYKNLSDEDKNAVNAYNMTNDKRVGGSAGSIIGQNVIGRIRATHEIKKQIGREQAERKLEAQNKFNDKYKQEKAKNKKLYRSSGNIFQKIKAKASEIKANNLAKKMAKENSGLNALEKEKRDKVNKFKENVNKGKEIVNKDMTVTAGKGGINTIFHPNERIRDINDAAEKRADRTLALYSSDKDKKDTTKEYKI